MSHTFNGQTGWGKPNETQPKSSLPVPPERGHTTEDCRALWSHLEQLVNAGNLKQFLYQPNRLGGQGGSGAQRDSFARPPFGTISVILATSGKIGSQPSRVMSVARVSVDDSSLDPKRSRMEVQSTLSFSDEDKVGTLQPHDDALVVTLKIGGYDVKRVLVDQGSGIEIMYPDLFKGLKLRSEDLTCYDSPLIGFDKKIVFLKGQI